MHRVATRPVLRLLNLALTAVRKALDAMKAQASLFKVLGSFPKAVL